MTHEELLAKIESRSCCSGTHEIALRAVVEMHRPFNADTDKPSCSRCMDATMESGKYEMMMSPYPCETIRTIEKELS